MPNPDSRFHRIAVPLFLKNNLVTRWLTRTVFILSAVSCLNDMASELLYPVLPLYMASIGYGAIWIGMLEGFAEAVSGLTKAWFGQLSDHSGRRLPYVKTGYLMSALSKPLLTLFTVAPWAMLMRTSDRFGKGIRTGARDALLADETKPSVRGKVFGFHRALDTLGAVAGPMAAVIWLNYHRGESYRPLFLYALIPGTISIALLFLIREKRMEKKKGKLISPFVSFSYWKTAEPYYRKLMSGILLFLLFNSSDLFLLMLVRSTLNEGLMFGSFNLSADMLVVLMYVFYNLVYALLSYPVGILGDKFGPKRMLLSGYACFVLAYGGMAVAASGILPAAPVILVSFFVYGVQSALTEGTSRAWISQLCHKHDNGVALGLFAALTSIAALVASVSAGLIWKFAGPAYVFILPAAFALVAIIYLTFALKSPVVKDE